MRLRYLTGLLICAGWACGNGNDARVAPCTTANSTMLGSIAVGAYNVMSPGANGCVLFAANSSPDTVEYAVVAQSVSGGPNRTATFRLAGEAMMSAPPLMSDVRQPEPMTPAEQFHLMLREREAESARLPRPATPPQMLVRQGPPGVGDTRGFKVCSTISCIPPMTDVTAQVKAVGQHVAIYVDVTTPTSGGLTQSDYDSLVAVFDQRIYGVDTDAFGQPSDRDLNEVVMVLMSPQINRLVTAQACLSTGFIAGYFFGNDLAPALDANPNYNKGEVFYTIVPDPTGQYSCSHSVTRVKQLIPPVFVHELQHMISFNYHVLIPGGPVSNAEVVWLNEALSHYAEELGGRTYLPDDNATFSAYVTGNVRNAYSYLSATGNNFLVYIFGNGTLAERGAGWLFVRYLVDQLATDTSMAAWNVVTRNLVQTTTVGTANIENVTGVPFGVTVAHWGLALWVSDLPGFTAPPELRYRSWAFRSTYGALYPSVFARPYPLEPPVTSGADVELTGTLKSGSGMYARVKHPPAAGTFTLQLADADGTVVDPGVEPRLSVIRVR